MQSWASAMGLPVLSVEDFEQGHLLVRIVLVVRALLGRIGQIGCGAPVGIRIQQLASVHLQHARLHIRMRPLDGLQPAKCMLPDSSSMSS